MTDDPIASDTPFIAPGTKVRLNASDEEGNASGEEGFVVHCWMNPEIMAYDCYVALFDGPVPDRHTDTRPTIWRYATTSLTPLSGDQT